MRRLGVAIAALSTSILQVSCAWFPPSPRTQAAEVARLEAHVVPVVGALQVRRYLNEGPSCNRILYRLGEYCDGNRCGSPKEGYRPFDERVREDFDRLATAMRTSNASTHRFEASFAADGALTTISFRREDFSIEWNWFYLYDPTDSVAKNQNPAPPTYTRITEKWWLVTEVDD